MSFQSFRAIKYMKVEALALTASFMTTLVIFVVSGQTLRKALFS
jgi:hypothetical protein